MACLGSLTTNRLSGVHRLSLLALLSAFAGLVGVARVGQHGRVGPEPVQQGGGELLIPEHLNHSSKERLVVIIVE